MAAHVDCPMVSVVTGSTSFSVHGIVVSTAADGTPTARRRGSGPSAEG